MSPQNSWLFHWSATCGEARPPVHLFEVEALSDRSPVPCKIQ